jgi:hypothetical protein
VIVSPRSATGTRLPLPAGARPPFGVYVRGVEQTEGVDFVVGAGELRFTRPLHVGRPESWWQRLVSLGAGIGFYGQGDPIDLHYVDEGGAVVVASNVRVVGGEPTPAQ